MDEMESPPPTVAATIPRRYVERLHLFVSETRTASNAFSHIVHVQYIVESGNKKNKLTNELWSGLDLKGNTYWEFQVAGSGPNERWRRIVKYPRSTHYSEVRISPQWHQWLRYTRPEPPTMEEQRGDVARQFRIKQLAAEADARWEAKPRLTDAPGEETGQRVPPLAVGGEGADRGAGDAPAQPKTASSNKVPDQKQYDHDPWAQAKARGPSEKWQPQAWAPPSPGKK